MKRQLGILSLALALVFGYSTLSAEDASAEVSVNFGWGFEHDFGDVEIAFEPEFDNEPDYDFDDYDYGFNPHHYSSWEYNRRVANFSQGFEYGYLNHGEYSWLKHREDQRYWHWRNH